MSEPGNGGTEAAEQLLGDDIRTLATEVRTLSARFRVTRVSNIVLAVVVAGMIVLGILYWLDVETRRHDTYRQIRDLACLAVRPAPPGESNIVDQIRAKYACPPFNPADAVRTPTATATRTLAAKPGPTRTLSVPSRVPGATVTVDGATQTRHVPGPTRTVTRTTVATRTVTAHPPPTCLGRICLPPLKGASEHHCRRRVGMNRQLQQNRIWSSGPPGAGNTERP